MEEQSFPVSPTSEEPVAPMERASFLERFFAFLIDVIILSIISACINMAGIQNLLYDVSDQMQGWWSAARGIAIGLIPVFYFTWAYSTSGQTPGKRVLKIKVVSIDGTALNFRKGIIRTFGYISSLPFYLGYLWSIKDKNRQTWHDKMAGTYVVPAFITREQFLGSIDPAEAQRRQRPWLTRLGIPTIGLILLSVAAVLFFTNRGLTEVKELGEWPGKEVSPERMITMDLTHLGLNQSRVIDARDQADWAEGNYQEGVMITYGDGTNEYVAVCALRYDKKQTAQSDYQALQASASEPGSCGWYVYAFNSNSGIIHCQFSNMYQKFLWKDYWIISILALEGTQHTPEVLVYEVRDAIAAHWKAIGSD